MLFHERLQMLMEDNNISKQEFIQRLLSYNPISKRTKKTIGDKTIYAYMSGTRFPDAEHYPLIAKSLGVDLPILFGETKKEPVNNPDYTMLRSYNVKAGAGAEGYLPDTLESTRLPVSNKLLNGANPEFLHIIQVAGDSMQPTISDNDWLIVDMVSDGKVDRVFEKVNGIYLINRDGIIQIKRLEFLGNKGIDIISDNPIYETKNTIKDSIELEIIGKLFKQIKDLGSLTIKELD